MLFRSRIGSSAGIAITGSVFYSQVASSHGDFASAFRAGVIVIGAFVAAALLLALADAATGARRERDETSAGRPAADTSST